MRLLALGMTLVLARVLSFGQAVAAVSNPASVPSKIAFVNLQEALVGCEEGKQQSAALQQRFSAKQAALKAADEELKKLKDEVQSLGSSISEEERSERSKVIQDKQKAFERAYADYQSETQEAQQNAINVIVRKMLPVLEKYVTDNGYTAVFDVSNPQAPILWVRKSSVITHQLIEAYNAQYPAPPPAPPVAPASPAPSTAPPAPQPTSASPPPK